MKSTSVLALALAAGTAALPEVAFRAIQISRRFALNHHRVLSPHTIVRRSSRNFAARRTTSTASAGASLASATTTASRGLFRTSIRSPGPTAGVTPPSARVAMCASKDVSTTRCRMVQQKKLVSLRVTRGLVLDSSSPFDMSTTRRLRPNDGISWIKRKVPLTDVRACQWHNVWGQKQQHLFVGCTWLTARPLLWSGMF